MMVKENNVGWKSNKAILLDSALYGFNEMRIGRHVFSDNGIMVSDFL